ncbi:small subunit ribosomal protein S4 [Ruminococcus sp. YE71]|uniref:30S ribosomal protein S4 n=1 Tax=unclassified Ruminococcus TaxID=2608920 RepID=UPI000890E426|nr:MULTISPECIES: 30S ribosomal protein S4 [unclassified Ruminococcus]SDA09839.1 small subunit ribosomal protein S4 [Ruminococcus sp. YE78]SFW11308.1 small subunit ribosomal protein S4 [Ruminococcus sp. YE71]
MAVNKKPILKTCRELGISPMVMGVGKETKRDPGAGKRKKVSEYGTQLKEKQKLRFIYGVLEKQFRHTYEIAQKMEGQAGENLITLLEERLDSVVFRMGLALTRREARQLVTHGHFLVNGKRVDIPSYTVKVGDTISLSDKSKKSEKFKQIVEGTADRLIPAWLDVNKEALTAKVLRAPVKEDLDYEVEEHLIVELYSR